jgi:hypothetical protein
MLYSWRWSTGEGYYKSPRNDSNRINGNINESNIAENAINQSIEPSSFFNQDQETIFSRNRHSKREQIDDKMSDREMIAQRGVNPFMQSNYVTDVTARDMFLKPVNTNSHD